MAFAIDVSSSGISTGSSGLTFSHTNSGNYLAVAVKFYDTTTLRTISSVTYAGSAMTLKTGSLQTADDGFGGDMGVAWYEHASPATGANDVVITMSAICAVIVGGSTSFTDANTSTPSGTAAINTGTDNAPTVTVGSAVGEISLAAVNAFANSAAAFTTGDTQQWERYDSGNGIAGAGSSQTGAASVVHDWATDITGFGWVTSGMSIKPTGGGGGGGGGTAKKYRLKQGMRMGMERGF